jgi:hypothetical protein
MNKSRFENFPYYFHFIIFIQINPLFSSSFQVHFSLIDRPIYTWNMCTSIRGERRKEKTISKSNSSQTSLFSPKFLPKITRKFLQKYWYIYTVNDKNLSDLHLSFLLFCVYLSPSKSNPFCSPTILCSFWCSFQRWVN